MKAGCIVAALFIVGCAPMQSLEELEADALQTGDWSLVEAREALIAKRNARRPRQCASGQISYCEKNVGVYRCVCASKGVMYDAFAAR